MQATEGAEKEEQNMKFSQWYAISDDEETGPGISATPK